MDVKGQYSQNMIRQIGVHTRQTYLVLPLIIDNKMNYLYPEMEEEEI